MADTNNNTEIAQLKFSGSLTAVHRTVFTYTACELVAQLVREFRDEHDSILARRLTDQARFDAGELPDFLPETKEIRNGDWQVSKVPPQLLDRRVEITGPVDRKMVINALNSDAKVFMADFEDSLSPTWTNVADGQVNLRDAAALNIEFADPKSGKEYRLQPDPATLICRVRGIHLPELMVTLNGKAIPGCLLDFGIYLANNAKTLLKNGSGPYFYIPKLQSHFEAQWWSKVIAFAENSLGLDKGTVKVTCLIETLPAVFQMHEILHALKDNIVALNCGRWDYIFSYIKTLKAHRDRVLPDRQGLSMDKHFLASYSKLLIQTCHRRGALAMGGMSAFIPARTPQENAAVTAKVLEDKEREAHAGHDGTWIAHPLLASIALGVFDETLADKPNQMDKTLADIVVTRDDLLQVPKGSFTFEGIRKNIRVSVYYMEAWLRGLGCVPVYGMMEDAATVEISRASIWQWIHFGWSLDSGEKVTEELFRKLLQEELQVVRSEVGDETYTSGKFEEAAEIFADMTLAKELADFLTLPCLERINS